MFSAVNLPKKDIPIWEYASLSLDSVFGVNHSPNACH